MFGLRTPGGFKMSWANIFNYVDKTQKKQKKKQWAINSAQWIKTN